MQRARISPTLSLTELHCLLCNINSIVAVCYLALRSPLTRFQDLHKHLPLRRMYETPASPCSSVATDDDDVDFRVSPEWCRYRAVIEGQGYHLETVRDVRTFYQHFATQHPQELSAKHVSSMQAWTGHPSDSEADNDLCKDRGLPDNLFRGSRPRDGKKVIVKAVGIYSHELDVVQYLSSPPLRRHSANHTIPILDLIRVPQDGLAFIVQEEWSSTFAHCAPCSLRGFLHATRQCIEGLCFMHAHHVAHLDISLSNILTNNAGSYAYIDFELSRRFQSDDIPLVRCIRGTELPPEIERGGHCCPFKIDIWALGVTILRACKAAGYEIVELLMITEPMLRESPQDRPSARTLLREFDRLFVRSEPTEWAETN